jgi:hypothetical protein
LLFEDLLVTNSDRHLAHLKVGDGNDEDGQQPQKHKSNNERFTSKRLPLWIQHYLQWHQTMRSKFVGEELFTRPDAPKLLIRTCLGLCGGLNDRLGQLEWDLYLANQTSRLLLIHWHRPVPIEHFLQPSEMDWRVPTSVEGFFPTDGAVRVSRDGMKKVRSIKGLFDGYDEIQPTDAFWSNHLDQALDRANHGTYKEERILRHRLLGHLNGDIFEERLLREDEGEKVTAPPMLTLTTTTRSQVPSHYGDIFWILFRPSLDIERQLSDACNGLNLLRGEYTAVHCRVRHPKATPKEVTVKGIHDDSTADKSGLPWIGETKKVSLAPPLYLTILFYVFLSVQGIHTGAA